MKKNKFSRIFIAAALASACSLFPLSNAVASSHSDAPLIKLDPQANLTDVYAFISLNNSGVKVLNVEVSVRPFSEPGDGVMYDTFSPDALYSIHITDPATGAEERRYDFQFSAVDFSGGGYKNGNTILRYGRGTAIGAISTVGDAQQNYTQTYSVTQVAGSTSTQLNGTPLLVPPPNVGKRTTPSYNDATGRAVSGATSRAALDSYTKQTVFDLTGGTTVFAGSREDGFYADTPGIFDLLDPRILGSGGHGQDGTGVDGFKGYNVLHYAIQIPVSQLTPSSYSAVFPTRTETGVGVYASVSRPRITLRQTTQKDTSSGPYIQVNRLGNPLFNEVLVAVQDKDNYNRRVPTDDASMFQTYALNPEVAVLINAVFGTSFVTSGRTDLAAVYIPDVVRVSTNTGAVPVAGEAGFNRLSFIGGDTVSNGTANIPSGWPNGRRFGDDVVDIALTAVASGPSYSSIFLLGDNSNANDQVYNQTFPYAGTPNAGPRNTKDSGPNVMASPTPTPAASSFKKKGKNK